MTAVSDLSADIILDLIEALNIDRKSDTEFMIDESPNNNKNKGKGQRKKKGQDRGRKRKIVESNSELDALNFDSKSDTEFKIDESPNKKKNKGKGQRKKKGQGRGRKIKMVESDSDALNIDRKSDTEFKIDESPNKKKNKGKGQGQKKGLGRGRKRKMVESDHELDAKILCADESEKTGISDSDYNSEYDLIQDDQEDYELDSKKKRTKAKKTKRKVKNVFVYDCQSDTDVDIEDDEAYTEIRRLNKQARYDKRVLLKKVECVSTLEGNVSVLNLFKEYIRKTYSLTAWNRETSTYKLSIGYIFTYKDSYLNFELKKDPYFKLEHLIKFDCPDFRELEDPTDWIMSLAGPTGKENPDDRVEMIKAWKRFNLFIKEELIKSRPNIDKDVHDLMRFRFVLDSLDSLYKKIDKSKMMSAAKVLSNVNKRERENREEFLSPSKRLAETDVTKNWFKSDIYRSELDKITTIWKDIMNKKKKIGKKEFNRLAYFVKFQLMLTSKNRNSCYKFTNDQYGMRSGLWIPDDQRATFDSLPSEYISEAPQENPDKPANCWIIKLSGAGAGIKNQEAQVIFINQMCQDLLDKYDDIKDILMPDEPGDKAYFVNFDSKPILDIPNTRGSLWQKYASVSNLDKASMNTIRRELEHKVQSSPVALSRIKDIQSHSQDTGSGAYDKTSPFFRACYMNFVSNIEGNNKQIDEPDLPENIQEVRSQREDKQKQRCLESVKLLKSKQKSRRKLSNTTRLLPDDRIFLEKIFIDESFPEISNAVKGIFPKNSQFKKLFYRLVDGPNELMSNDVCEQLKEIEERIFLTIKEVIENEFKEVWQEDSKDMNRLADKKICKIIRNSFYFHEKNKPLNEKKTFVFSRKNSLNK